MSPKLQNRLLKLAKELVCIIEPENKHISFLLDKNKIVSIGWNDSFQSNKFSQKLPFFEGSRHSELHCYARLKNKKDIKHLTLINVRLSKTCVIGQSKPCKICLGFLAEVQPKRVYYTNPQGKFERLW